MPENAKRRDACAPAFDRDRRNDQSAASGPGVTIQGVAEHVPAYGDVDVDGSQLSLAAGTGTWTTMLSAYFSAQYAFTSAAPYRRSSAVRSQVTTVWLSASA